ncbi:MAG: thioredoxin fold domain-containing protein [Bacteroidales bacterium]|jgi:thiol-disulfide isomerase/thioredoxin|nr:thioredoxin fold domain-containing protein [Bacteroidales bacterium]
MKRFSYVLSSIIFCVLFTAALRPVSAQTPSDESVKHIPMELIQNPDNPILLMFTASWCAPCHKMRSVMFKKESISVLLRKYNLVILDVESQPGSDLQRIYCEDRVVPQYIVMDKEQNVLRKMRGATDDEYEFADFLRSGIEEIRPGMPAVQDIVTQEQMEILTGNDYKAATSRLKAQWSFGVGVGGHLSTMPVSSRSLFAEDRASAADSLQFNYNGVKPGGSISALVRYTFYKSTIESGLLFMTAGGRDVRTKENFNSYYIGIPFDFHFGIWNDFKGGVGLSAMYMLNDVAKNRFDAGLRLKLLWDAYPFCVGAGWQRGLVNILGAESPLRAHNNHFFVNFAFYFN